MVYQQHALDRILIAFQSTVLKAPSTEIRAFFLFVCLFEWTLSEKGESAFLLGFSFKVCGIVRVLVSDIWYTNNRTSTALDRILIAFQSTAVKVLSTEI